MHHYAIKSFIAGALGVAVLTGCASPSSSPTMASTARNVQNGKVIAIEPAAAVSQSTMESSSGSSGGSGGMAAGSEGPVVTVLFADGTETRYTVEQRSTSFVVGDPVKVITDRDSAVMISP